VDRADADPGTVGTAADWLLRFLVHPQPDRHLAMLGVMRCARAKINLLTAFAEIAESLGSSRSSIAADFKALAGAAPGNVKSPSPARCLVTQPRRSIWPGAAGHSLFSPKDGVAAR
jgi:hypothetical protein